MGIPLPGNDGLYIETGPGSSHTYASSSGPDCPLRALPLARWSRHPHWVLCTGFNIRMVNNSNQLFFFSEPAQCLPSTSSNHNEQSGRVQKNAKNKWESNKTKQQIWLLILQNPDYVITSDKGSPNNFATNISLSYKPTYGTYADSS